LNRGRNIWLNDFWWHLGHDTMVTSEWGTPNMIENGLVPELLLNSKYGHQLHIWDLRRRRHLQTLDLGATAVWCWSCAPHMTHQDLRFRWGGDLY